nr:ribonuclease H-like domain, reverse transcriptase, RNA-dependent DNA polymerase [Tanacetum cinerariifolium]
MEEKFKMSDLGLLANYLGIEVKQTNGDISIKESAYASKILKEAGMLDCNETLIPMDPGTRLTKITEGIMVNSTEYRSIIGCLRYLLHIRPDLSYSVGLLSHFMQEPRKQHMKAIRQVLRYVKGTKDHGITYKHNGGNKIHGYSDNSYGVNTQEGKGTTGIIFYYRESPISWSTQKQEIVALSSCELEFIAATAATQALWLKRLLSKLTHSQEEKITIQVDNKSAIALMKNLVFHGRRAELDGGYVVPYNPTLLKRYQAHINVESCNQFGLIKYLFKYINKGPDRVTATVEDEEMDEIKDYYDCRYLSSCKATWRIFKFDIHHRFPAVERLPFHLPNQQSIVFDPSESIDYQLEKTSSNTSKFLARMERNKTDTDAQKLLLLNHVRGAQEWEDFRKYDNVVYSTCKDACYARGLLDDDKEYVDGIIKANLQLSDIQRYNICLTYIEDKLLSCSKSLKNIVNMPYPNAEFIMEGYNMLIYDELDYKLPELIIQHETLHKSLTNEKKEIYETILDACNNNTRGMFFVYAYGGTGKTFLYKTLTAALRSKGQIVLNVASSGIASLLLDGGRTAHSRFAIPINIVEYSMCTISADSDLAELIRKAKLIIWDEAPMINKLAYEAFERTLRDICSSNNVLMVKWLSLVEIFVKYCMSFQMAVGKTLYTLHLTCLIYGSIAHEGKISGKNDGQAEVEFPEEMLIHDSDDHLDAVIKETYDN